jgi:hypothetical protein
MPDGAAATTVADRAANGIMRVIRVWRALARERRLAAYAAFGLFAALFLPWYQETVIASGKVNLRSASATLTGWGAFSFAEAALLVTAAGVLTLLFQRAEGRAFHLPGGDGFVVMAAGVWSCVLIVWRIFDKQGTSSQGQLATTSGIEWGIFVALAVAAVLAYAGSRIRAAHQPEPPLPGDDEDPPEPEGRAPTEPVLEPIGAPSARERTAAPAPADREPGWLLRGMPARAPRPKQRRDD